jgi:hypothetical protein
MSRHGRTCNARHLAVAVIKERVVSDFHSFHEILCLMISLVLLKLGDIPLRPRAMFYFSAQAGVYFISRKSSILNLTSWVSRNCDPPFL